MESFPSKYIIEEVSFSGWDGFGTVESLNASLRGAVESVAAGCPRVEAATPGLAAALGRGAYFLDFVADPSGDIQPQRVDYTTRLYSPCGQAKSIDFNYDYYEKVYYSYVDMYCTCNYLLRGAACLPGRPQGKKKLFHMTCEDCGCDRIRLKMNGPKLQAIQKELLGRSDLLSSLAMMNLLMAAATQVGQCMARQGAAPLLREARRRLEPRPGETPDVTGYVSDDSDGDRYPQTSRRCPRWSNRCTAGSDDGWSTEPGTEDGEEYWAGH